MNVPMTAEKLQKVAKEILEDSSCGAVFRIKGFIKAEDNSWIQLNATHNGVRMEPIQEGQEVIIVIGEHLQRDRIEAYIGAEKMCIRDSSAPERCFIFPKKRHLTGQSHI